MSDIQVSLYGSFAKPYLWEKFWKQYEMNTVKYEIVMACPHRPTDIQFPKNVKFIVVQPDPGPAKLCWVASKYAEGETLMQIADDNVQSPYILDKMYETYKKENDYKCIVYPRFGFGPDSDVTDVNEELRIPGTDLKWGAQVMWSRQFYWELGGIDRYYTGGATEQEMLCRAFSQGGRYVYAEGAYNQEDLSDIGHNALSPERAWRRFGGHLDNAHMKRRWFPNNSLLDVPQSQFKPNNHQLPSLEEALTKGIIWMQDQRLLKIVD